VDVATIGERDSGLVTAEQGSDFFIGGPSGVSAELAKRAHKRWSLFALDANSRKVSRVVLLEQLYRAYTIINGLPYQK
jgi:23S rRNA (pseudouridine1915-N3)-methyltransferase